MENTVATEAKTLLASHAQQAYSGVYVLPDDIKYFAQEYLKTISKDNAICQLGERAMIRRLVTDIIAAGHPVRVFDGEANATPITTKIDRVMDAVMAAEDEWIFVFRSKEDRTHIATIQMVYGNSPEEVFADYSVSLEPLFMNSIAFGEAMTAAARN